MKKVKITTIALGIVLVALVAFAGVYIQTQNRMENKVKDYDFNRELKGGRVIEIKVSDGTSDSEDENEDNNTQNPEDLTVENYEIVKKTVEERLKALGAEDYTISLNKEDGTIRVELAEDDNTDTYAYYLTASGKVQLKEKDTETELLSDSMVKKASYNYKSDSDGKYQVYLELVLNKEGQAKIEEISNTYAILSNEIDEIEAAQEEKETDTEETDSENNEENPTEETPVEEQTTENVEENNEQQEETTTKKIAVLTIAGSEYDIEKIEKNKITVKIGGQTSNTTSVNNNMSKSAELTMMINAGKYPIEYEIKNNRYMYSDITNNEILYFALIILALILVGLIILCIKYKVKGLLCSISYIGFVAILTLLLRYTNVLISIEGIGAIIFILAINFKFNQSILSKLQKINLVNEAINNTYKETFLKLIPIMIISIVFCFAGWANLSSFGMVMFWGLVLIAIYNITITKALLKLRENK